MTDTAKQSERYLLFNIGCIECGVGSNVVGTYASFEDAERDAGILNKKLAWRDGGQNSFEVYDLLAEQPEEYRAALKEEQ